MLQGKDLPDDVALTHGGVFLCDGRFLKENILERAAVVIANWLPIVNVYKILLIQNIMVLIFYIVNLEQ